MNAALLNSAESAIIEAMRLGHTIQIVAAEPIPVPSVPTVSAFMSKMLKLNGTAINRRRVSNRPAAVINTVKGRRGVFWVGYKNGEFRIGTCKMTVDGYLHQMNRFDGCFFQAAESLEAFNR